MAVVGRALCGLRAPPLLVQKHRTRVKRTAWRGQTWTGRHRAPLPMAAMKLYTSKVSRGKIVEWYLKELGAWDDVEMITVDMQDKEHKKHPYLKVNPYGKLPALEDGDLKLFETGAILLYIAENFSNDADTPQKRATLAKWLFHGNTDVFNVLSNERFREQQAPGVFGPLDELLGKQDYVEGEFTVADVGIASTLALQPVLYPNADMSKYPNIEKYMKRIVDRPAFQEMLKPAMDMVKERIAAERQKK